MSNRITKKWTKTTEEAFGNNSHTRKGYKAEKIIYDYLIGVYDKVIWNESNRKKQLAGMDFEFKKSIWSNFYSADVKGNLSNTHFFVYPKEILRKSNHRMIHVDVNTGKAVEYDRVSMLRYIRDINGLDKEYFIFNITDKELKRRVAYFRVFNAKRVPKTLENVISILNNYDLPE